MTLAALHRTQLALAPMAGITDLPFRQLAPPIWRTMGRQRNGNREPRFAAHP